jgi:hypothetical protein
MKKFFILAVMFLMVVALVPAVNAAPAPALTKATILKVGPDAGGDWINVTNHVLPSGNNSVYGDTLYVFVNYVGYPNAATVVFSQSGKAIDPSKVKLYQSVPITNSGGIVIGFDKTYTIPFSALPGAKTGNLGQIYLDAKGTNGGSAYDYVVNINKK